MTQISKTGIFNKRHRVIKIPAQGFTLLEMMIVIFIISFIFAVALPSFPISQNKLKTEARKVASILRYLNETSASKKETFFLKFNLDEDTIEWEDSGGTKTEKIKTLSAVKLSSKGTVKEGELIVFFEPLGLKEHLRVYLEHSGKEMTVAFNPISGRTKILND